MNIAAIRACATPYALALLRVITGLLFVEHGSSKLLGFPPARRRRGVARNARVHRDDRNWSAVR